jgi:hypothetical protein
MKFQQFSLEADSVSRCIQIKTTPLTSPPLSLNYAWSFSNLIRNAYISGDYSESICYLKCINNIIIIIIIIMSIVPSGAQVVYTSSPSFSVPDDKPEITPAVLPTFIQCSSSPWISCPTPSSCHLGKLPLLEKCLDIPQPYSCPYLLTLVRHQVSVWFSLLCRLLENL